LRIWVARQKPRHLMMVFLPEHGTRHVEEFTTSRQQPPQGLENVFLRLREFGGIGQIGRAACRESGVQSCALPIWFSSLNTEHVT